MRFEVITSKYHSSYQNHLSKNNFFHWLCSSTNPLKRLKLIQIYICVNPQTGWADVCEMHHSNEALNQIETDIRKTLACNIIRNWDIVFLPCAGACVCVRWHYVRMTCCNCVWLVCSPLDSVPVNTHMLERFLSDLHSIALLIVSFARVNDLTDINQNRN